MTHFLRSISRDLRSLGRRALATLFLALIFAVLAITAATAQQFVWSISFIVLIQLLTIGSMTWNRNRSSKQPADDRIRTQIEEATSRILSDIARLRTVVLSDEKNESGIND